MLDLEGGLRSWEATGLSLRRLSDIPPPVMRQVPIGAGSLVLLSFSDGCRAGIEGAAIDYIRERTLLCRELHQRRAGVHTSSTLHLEA